MGLLWTLIIGAVAGWLAGKIMRGGGFGLLGDIIVGVIGRWLGILSSGCWASSLSVCWVHW